MTVKDEIYYLPHSPLPDMLVPVFKQMYIPTFVDPKTGKHYVSKRFWDEAEIGRKAALCQAVSAVTNASAGATSVANAGKPTVHVEEPKDE